MSRTVFCPEEVIVVSNGKEDIGKLVALGNDGKFDTSVIPEIDELGTQIIAEVTARTEADTQLQANIDAEALARTNADAKLQSNVDAETSARSSADQDLQAKITAEVAARTEGDAALQTNMDTEAAARAEADKQLQSNIDAEATARTAADATLQSNIDVEASARESADQALEAELTKEVAARTEGDAALQTNMDTEAAARVEADKQLQSNIEAEATARTAADATLQGNIDAEASVRSSADQVLQEQINSLNGENAFSKVLVNGVTVAASSQTDTVELAAGTNIALIADAENKKVTIAVDGKVASAEAADTAAACTGNAATADLAAAATKLTTARTISFTGDATGAVAFDGSADESAALTLASSGVTAGTYTSVTVDAKGRVTAGANPTSLAVDITGNAATATLATTATTANKTSNAKGIAFSMVNPVSGQQSARYYVESAKTATKVVAMCSAEPSASTSLIVYQNATAIASFSITAATTTVDITDVSLSVGDVLYAAFSGAVNGITNITVQLTVVDA